MYPKGRVVFFATGNIHKFHEVRKVLAKYKIATAMLNLEVVEIQDDNLENIAKTSALNVAEKFNLPIFTEDSGLFIEPLNGFPGPYSSYIYRTLGTHGIIRLMKDMNTRNAYFQSVIAFCNSKERSVWCFHGRVKGKIVHNERGKHGFGFDPIFEPKNVSGKTFAEMTDEEKILVSHRSQALQRFIDWYTSSGLRSF